MSGGGGGGGGALVMIDHACKEVSLYKSYTVLNASSRWLEKI